jgi:23S rRNA (adenine2030-N6)-methyltransferase
MNYRHAYHAGNFADVVKHLVLTRILVYLAKKDTPFRVFDTHAGIGLYDLDADEATRTQEWREGVGRLDEPFDAAQEQVLAEYRGVLASVRERYGPSVYPGSPAIIREMLRPQDRGILNELHPQDFALLCERYNQVPNLKTLHLDAWSALHAMIPPREKRGLVLVDPPFEEPGEMDRLVEELARAIEKWPTGIFAAWYPVKDLRAVNRSLAPLAQFPRNVLRLELYVERPDDPTRLTGCGLAVVNPPWTLQNEMETVLPELAARLARDDYGAFRCESVGAPA